jgi:hypothetical protein
LVSVIRTPASCLGNAGFQAGQECYGDASLWRSHHVLVGICIFGWRQTMPNHSGAEKLRLLPSLSHSAYSGIRHSRHTYRSWLDALGSPIGLQQRMMRHFSITTTANYGDTVPADLRQAHEKVVQRALQHANGTEGSTTH